MDTGQGGVGLRSADDHVVEVERRDAPTWKSQDWAFPTIVVWFMPHGSANLAHGAHFHPAEARQLAAALVALADEISREQEQP